MTCIRSEEKRIHRQGCQPARAGRGGGKGAVRIFLRGVRAWGRAGGGVGRRSAQPTWRSFRGLGIPRMQEMMGRAIIGRLEFKLTTTTNIISEI